MHQLATSNRSLIVEKLSLMTTAYFPLLVSSKIKSSLEAVSKLVD